MLINKKEGKKYVYRWQRVSEWVFIQASEQYRAPQRMQTALEKNPQIEHLGRAGYALGRAAISRNFCVAD